MPGRQRHEQMPMNHCQPAPRHDQPAIGGARKGGDDPLNLSRVAHIERNHLYLERGRCCLDRTPLAKPLGYGGVAKHRRSRYVGRYLFENLQPFSPISYSYKVKPVALPPGRAKLSTNPAPTGSGVCVNTMGTLRVSCTKGPATEPPDATMTSGASAISSVAYLR